MHIPTNQRNPLYNRQKEEMRRLRWICLLQGSRNQMAKKVTKSVLEVDFDCRENQQSDGHPVIGSEANNFVKKCGEVLNINSLYDDVTNYFVKVCAYMAKKFP